MIRCLPLTSCVSNFPPGTSQVASAIMASMPHSRTKVLGSLNFFMSSIVYFSCLLLAEQTAAAVSDGACDLAHIHAAQDVAVGAAREEYTSNRAAQSRGDAADRIDQVGQCIASRQHIAHLAQIHQHTRVWRQDRFHAGQRRRCT